MRTYPVSLGSCEEAGLVGSQGFRANNGRTKAGRVRAVTYQAELSDLMGKQ